MNKETLSRRDFVGDALKLGIAATGVGIGIATISEMLNNPSPVSNRPTTTPTPDKKAYTLPTEEYIIRRSTIEAIDGKQSLTADQIRKILKRNDGNPELIEAAGAFVKYGKEYGIDCAWALAFCIKESAGGMSGVATETKSIGNLVWTPKSYSDVSYGRNFIPDPVTGELVEKGRFRRYKTWEEGIKDYFALLKEGYIKGKIKNYPLKTPNEILPVYAPSHENDTKKYIEDVSKWVGKWRKEFQPQGIFVSSPAFPEVEIEREYVATPIEKLTIDQYWDSRSAISCESNCAPQTIILHYTGGTYGLNPETLDAYHFTVGFDGRVQEGRAWPESNAPGPDGKLTDPAWHTMFRSGKSVGIAIRGMEGIRDGRDCSTLGDYPMTKDAFEGMCMLAALEAKKYNIKPTAATILTHYELTLLDEGRDNYDSKGEHYDMACLSFVPGYKPSQVKTLILQRIMSYYNDPSVFFENHEKVKLVKPE